MHVVVVTNFSQARGGAEKDRKAESLRAIETALQASAETKAKLEREVAEIKKVAPDLKLPF